MAAVLLRVALAGLDEPFELVIGERVDHLAIGLGWLQPN
jgi:hypothetical protein